MFESPEWGYRSSFRLKRDPASRFDTPRFTRIYSSGFAPRTARTKEEQ
jgi:hypothetical protein